MQRFFQTSYAAASWSKPRKIVARVEASEQGSDLRFIVTNLPGRAKCSTKRSIARAGAWTISSRT
jgi:hypothetical protein